MISAIFLLSQMGDFDTLASLSNREKIMGDICRSCRQAPVEIIKVLDDPAEPYKVCISCFHKLMSHSLRPREWYNLSSIHGRLNDLLYSRIVGEGKGALWSCGFYSTGNAVSS